MKKCIFLRVLCKTYAIHNWFYVPKVWDFSSNQTLAVPNQRHKLETALSDEKRTHCLYEQHNYLSFLTGDVVIDAETVWWENCRTLYNGGAVSSQSDFMSPYTVLVHFFAVNAWLRRETSRLDEDVKTILRLFIFFWLRSRSSKILLWQEKSGLRKNQLHFTKKTKQTNKQTNKNKNVKWNGKMNQIASARAFYVNSVVNGNVVPRLLSFGLYFPIIFPFFVLNSLTKDLSAASEELEKSKQIIKELEEKQQSVKTFSSMEHFTFTNDCELAR